MTNSAEGKKPRFKDRDFNRAYWLWASMDLPGVLATFHPSSNREQEFRNGLIGWAHVPPRNSIGYPIYVAGKEWARLNPEQAKDPGVVAFLEKNAHLCGKNLRLPVFYLSDGSGHRRFSFHAPGEEAAASLAKGWCLYHSSPWSDGWHVTRTEDNDTFDLHDEYVR